MIPVAGPILILGLGWFTNEARALTNRAGNADATRVAAKWENALDPAHPRAVLNGDAVPPLSQVDGIAADKLVTAEQAH